MKLLVNSGLWIAAIAAGLLLATASALQVQVPWSIPAIAALGSFAVYNLDRLRDRQGDARTKPQREHFVGDHPRALGGVVLLSAVAAAVLGWRAGRNVVVLLLLVVLLSMIHRRLKHLPGIKPLYIAVAWLLVVVGLPMVVGQVELSRVAGEISPIGLAILANVLACDVADDEAEARRIGPAVAWNLARGLAALGVASALLARGELRPLGLIPLALLVALYVRRTDEWYVAVFIDGSLLVGAGLALLVSRLV